MKELMTMLGLAGGAVRPPLVPLRLEELEELKSTVSLWQKVAGAPKPVKTGVS